MYKISDFSKITNLTIKALRYYDEENILSPSYRDENNMYRYYDETDFRKAQLIVLLRILDFSISEIKDVVAHCENEADQSYYLEEKKDSIEKKIIREKELVEKIDLLIQPKKMEGLSMNYKIEIKEFAPVMVASIRFKGQYRVWESISEQYTRRLRATPPVLPSTCIMMRNIKKKPISKYAYLPPN